MGTKDFPSSGEILSTKEIRQLSPIITQMADTVVITNTEGVIEYVNPAFEQLTGYSLAEVLGKTPRILKSGQHGPDFYQQLWGAILRGEVFQGEIINRKKNGALYYETKTITPIRDAQGQVTHFVATGKDITEQKQAAMLQQTLYRIAEAAQMAESLNELYPQIHQHIAQVMDAANFYIALCETNPDRIRYVYSVDEKDGLPAAHPVPVGQGLTAHVLRTGKSLLLSAQDSTERGIQVIGSPAKVWLGAPLVVRGKTIGVMALQNYHDDSVYTEREQRMLEFVSSQVATVIDRKQAEENLRRSQASLETAQAIAHLGSWELDIQKNELKWSAEIYRIFGLHPHEFQATYEAFLAAIHPEDREMVHRAYQNSLQTRRPYEVIHRLLLKDGALKYVQEKGETYYDENGAPVRSLGTVQDITERRKMEMEIRTRVKELTCLFAVSRLLEDSAAAVPVVCQKIVEFLVPAMQYPELTAALLELDGTPYSIALVTENLTHRLSTPITVHGAPRGKLSVGYPPPLTFLLPEEQALLDNVARMLGLWLEQREAAIAMHVAQSALEELNRDLEQRVTARTAEVRDLYDHAPTGYHSLDAHGRYIMLNQTELKWVGYTREEMEGRPLQDFLTAESQVVFWQRFAAFREEGEARDVELEFIRKDGSRLPVVINATAVYDDKGRYLMSRSTMVDITERKKAEAALRDSRDKLSAANAALEKASHMKDEFLASMSHELRTPLTGILGLSEALQLQTLGPLNEKQQQALQNIESSGRHLLELINDILDLSKIEAGKLDLRFEDCPAAEIAQASLQLVKGMAQQKHQRLSFGMNLPAITVRADARRLKQMLVNLLSNAVKFTPAGGKLGLEVQANAAEQNVAFWVWDQGIGIPPEALEKLFKPFVQLDSSLARQYAGSGLGLSLVQRMAELHGGGVRVESASGGGSRFAIVLPWAETAPPEQKAPVPGVSRDTRGGEEPAMATGTGARAPLIMLADGSELILEQIADGLAAQGYHVIATRSGLELLERAPALHPALVLVDMQLPGIEGLETIRRLRAHSDPSVAATPIIAMTALAMPGDREKCLRAGANEYLTKPMPMTRLVNQMRTLLEQAAEGPNSSYAVCFSGQDLQD